MEKTKHYYLVSFGTSRQYRMEYDDVACHDSLHKPCPFDALEKDIRDYLEKEFPGQALAYYFTPKVVEISPGHNLQYESYPMLDAKAVEDIKHTLRREVADMESTKEMNLNPIGLHPDN